MLLLARYLRQNGEVRVTGRSSQKPIDLGLRLLGADRIAATPFQYSAVTALGASRLGVPARVVVGAEPAAAASSPQADVVSWVELQFADGTWRTLEPDRYTGVHPYAEDESDDDRLGARVGEGRARRLDKDKIKIPKGADIELSPDAIIEESPHPWRWWPSGLRPRRARAPGAAGRARREAGAPPRRRRTSSWSGLYVNGWQEVLDAALDLGTPVPDGWSRLAQADEPGRRASLAQQADAAVFAPSPRRPRRVASSGTRASRCGASWCATAGRRASGLVVLQPVVAHGRLGPRPSESAQQVRHEDRGARRQQPAGT